jgi:hypothetical protein
MNQPLPVPASAAPGFTLEEMKAFVRRHFDDFVNHQRSEVALQNFSDDFLDHDEPGGAVVGPLAAKTMMENVYRRWPDLRVEVQDILAPAIIRTGVCAHVGGSFGASWHRESPSLQCL